MPRVVSLFLPTWPTDRVRRKLADAAPSPEAPLVLVGRDARRRERRRLTEIGRFGLAPPAADGDAEGPGVLGGELEPAGGGH